MIDYDAIHEKNYQYGIVIDAGSSGSRLYIYKWVQSEYLLENLNHDNELMSSVPQIISNPNWNKKITPGISTYASNENIDDLYDHHLKPLIEFANMIIPTNKVAETPIFLQATAGMRLIPKNNQKKLLKNTCKLLNKHTKFKLVSCSEQIQIINGELEGIYGWLALNYLSQNFNGYQISENEAEVSHRSLGFMDMGGASTQIAFVPFNKTEILKHSNDYNLVSLRNINGANQKWPIFTSTWLGFGANQARKRYLNNLITLSTNNDKNKNQLSESEQVINDPCLPRELTSDYHYNDNEYKIKGIGDYEMCVKEQYPLLMKNLQCEDDPCLFNGVHLPTINYEHDKFVGISEYWYTINDIFNLGGEYNYAEFSKQLKLFCEDNWSEILNNYNKNQYNGIKLEFLKNSCFKGVWVYNILHEGFSLPKTAIDNDFHFKSVSQINDIELSWTLGKILLYACSLILSSSSSGFSTLGNYNEGEVGILPNEHSENTRFIYGNFEKNFNVIKSEKIYKINKLFFVFVVFSIIIMCSIFLFSKNLKHLNKFICFKFPILIKLRNMIASLFFKLFKNNMESVSGSNKSQFSDINLEEGLLGDGQNEISLPQQSQSYFASQQPTTSHSQTPQQHPPTFGVSPHQMKSNSTSYLNFATSSYPANFQSTIGSYLYRNNNSTASLVSDLDSAIATTSANNKDIVASPLLRSRVNLFSLGSNSSNVNLKFLESPFEREDND